MLKSNFIKKFCILLFIWGICAISKNTFAQEPSKDVTITASGSGKTIEEAKQSALRSATEQAFGAFISSKTEIFNDQVVADQMSSVSSGNIKSFEVLNEAQLPNNNWAATIKAVVSVDKLTSFVEAKGIAIEIKGGLFALNIKQQMLNEQGEVNAIIEMAGIIHEAMQTAFDYSIQSSEPQSRDAENKYWAIPLVVTATCNNNIDFCANYFKKTISSLALSKEEILSYSSLDKKLYQVNLRYKEEEKGHFLRKEQSLDIIKSLMNNYDFYIRGFVVHNGSETILGNSVDLTSKEKISSDKTWGNEMWGLSYFYGEPILNKIIVNFPTSGAIQKTFKWSDLRSLSQIEQMTGYSVKPQGVISKFKF